MTHAIAPRRGSLRARLFRVLAESPLPISTVDLVSLAAPDLPHAPIRVRQVLVREWARGRVLRLDPLPPSLPRGTGRQNAGRWAFRWALTPAGLLCALARPKRKVVPR